jgi:selenium metabolism protein YedF
MKKIDCRGLACPQPVMETKKALDSSEGQEVLVLVDDATARENVSRFAGSQGYQIEVTDEKGYSAIRIRKGELAGKKEESSVPKAAIQGDLVFFIDSDSLGRGSEELGGILMRAFLHTLGEAEVKPQKMILVNSGVKLACEGSPALVDLQTAASQGVEILACGTCLNYFELKEKLRAGRISNMYEILNVLSKAGRTVKF